MRLRRTNVLAAPLVIGLQLIGCLFFSWSAPGGVEAKTFVVNTTLDETDVNPGDGICVTATQKCALRAAVQEANAYPGPDTVQLRAGLHMLTIQGGLEDACASGDLDILDDITITGNGANRTFINGGSLDRVLHIVQPVSVKIIQLTIQNGLAGYSPSENAAGGGIYNNGGTLVVSKSSISNNSALREGLAVCGGGIYSASGQVTISESTVSENYAIGTYGSGQGGGGGIYVDGGILIVKQSVVSGNTAGGYNGGYGGGIYNTSGTLTLVESTFSDNFAFGTGYPAGGGGIFTSRGKVTIRGSTISHNSVQGTVQGSRGGAVAAYGSALTILQSTISWNSCLGSYGQGGGIYASGDIAIKMTSRISRNFASTDGGGIFSESGTPIISSDSIVAKNIPNNLSPSP